MGFNRRNFLITGTGAAVAAATGLGGPWIRRANAAEFAYKVGTYLPAIHPLNVRIQEASDAIKKMDAAFVAKGNECQGLAKAEAIKFSKKVMGCTMKPDSPTTLHCSTPAAYQACLKEKPYSPNCGIWNGEPAASCCHLGN